MAYELVAHTEVGSGGASSIEFTSIPQDGTDLVLKLSARDDSSAGTFRMTVNGLSTGIYTYIRLTGDGSSVSNFATTNSSNIQIDGVPGSGYTANTFGNTSIYFSNYTSTVAKSISMDAVQENNASNSEQQIVAAQINLLSGITSINVGGFSSGSTASLYKIS